MEKKPTTTCAFVVVPHWVMSPKQKKSTYKKKTEKKTKKNIKRNGFIGGEKTQIFLIFLKK